MPHCASRLHYRSFHPNVIAILINAARCLQLSCSTGVYAFKCFVMHCLVGQSRAYPEPWVRWVRPQSPGLRGPLYW